MLSVGKLGSYWPGGLTVRNSTIVSNYFGTLKYWCGDGLRRKAERGDPQLPVCDDDANVPKAS
jgi:hypothetical protein